MAIGMPYLTLGFGRITLMACFGPGTLLADRRLDAEMERLGVAVLRDRIRRFRLPRRAGLTCRCAASRIGPPNTRRMITIVVFISDSFSHSKVAKAAIVLRPDLCLCATTIPYAWL
jgi:hypothetical protein